MGPKATTAPGPAPASLVVVDPNGHRTRAPIDPLPFQIGRQTDNHLVVRDSRVSRIHARISAAADRLVVEDCGSTHGTFVNGKRVTRHTLENSDRIEFGTPDSYQLIFALDGVELKRLLEHVGAPESGAHPVLGSNLAKLRAILDLARTVQSSFSVDDVLASVVDTALAITGAERGFLLLRRGDALETRVARHKHGQKLDDSDLRVPREVIHRALQHRRELLSMNFDPLAAGQARLQSTISDLDLRSVTCVPLVRIRTALGDVTSVLSAGNETVGVLYMDSRVANCGHGRRESRAAANPRHRSLHGAGKRAPAGRGAGQAPTGGGAEAGAHHPAEPAARQASHRRLAARRRKQRGLARGGRRLLSTSPR